MADGIELTYPGKQDIGAILSETLEAKLTLISEYGSDPQSNMLIFGDNLPVLKTLLKMKEDGKLQNADGAPGDLTIMVAGRGYWIKMAGDDTLTGVGTLYEQLVPFKIKVLLSHH